MVLSKKAVLEVQELSRRAEVLARGSASQRKEADVLCQRINTIKQIGMSSDETRVLYADALVDETRGGSAEVTEKRHRAAFDKYARGGGDAELRNFEAGTQSLAATLGTEGGFFVPFAYDDTVYEAMAQVDPVMDRNVVGFTMTPTPSLQPSQISGYDLSSITGQLIGESTQQTPQAIPTVAGGILNANKIFKASMAASLESIEDVPDFTTKVIRAGSVALARKVGQSVMSGRGGTDITGISQSISTTLSNATAGKLTLSDLLNFYFAVNVFYRKSPKAGWLFSDSVYKLVRAAVDGQGRPLIDVIDDKEMLLGRPIFVSPSLGAGYSSIGVQGALIFGDLSHILVRASRPTMTLSFEQAEADITTGQGMYIFRMRADASYFDPSSGATPPLVQAAIS